MIYTSDSASLATLEMLVHLGRSLSLPQYVIFGCEFDDSLVEEIEASLLPVNWRSYPAPPDLAQLGDQWIQQGRSAVLRVPSAVLDTQSNYLFNPLHSSFRKIRISGPQRFTLDLRLLQ